MWWSNLPKSVRRPNRGFHTIIRLNPSDFLHAVHSSGVGPWYVSFPQETHFQENTHRLNILGIVVVSIPMSPDSYGAINFRSKPVSNATWASHFIKYFARESLAASFVAARCPTGSLW